MLGERSGKHKNFLETLNVIINTLNKKGFLLVGRLGKGLERIQNLQTHWTKTRHNDYGQDIGYWCGKTSERIGKPSERIGNTLRITRKNYEQIRFVSPGDGLGKDLQVWETYKNIQNIKKHNKITRFLNVGMLGKGSEKYRTSLNSLQITAIVRYVGL